MKAVTHSSVGLGVLLLAALAAVPLHAWQRPLHIRRGVLPSTALHAKKGKASSKSKGKGFGKKAPTTTNLQPIKYGGAPVESATSAPTGPPERIPLPDATSVPEFVDNPALFPEVSEGAADVLEQMREQEVTAKQSREARLAEIMEKKETLRENPDAGIIPEVVANRMIKRMAPLAAVPIFGGIALFVGFYLAAIKWDYTIPPAIVAYSTTVPWVLGLFGLTYGLMSASWDPEVEGSFWGWKEAQTNVQNLFGGLARSSEDRQFLAQYQWEQEQQAKIDEAMAPRNRDERRALNKKGGSSPPRDSSEGPK